MSPNVSFALLKTNMISHQDYLGYRKCVRTNMAATYEIFVTVTQHIAGINIEYRYTCECNFQR